MLLFCFRFLESTHKGVNYRPKYVIQIQQQRPESTTVTFTWHACKCKVHELHQRYTLFEFFNWTGWVGGIATLPFKLPQSPHDANAGWTKATDGSSKTAPTSRCAPTLRQTKAPQPAGKDSHSACPSTARPYLRPLPTLSTAAYICVQSSLGPSMSHMICCW